MLNSSPSHTACSRVVKTTVYGPCYYHEGTFNCRATISWSPDLNWAELCGGCSKHILPPFYQYCNNYNYKVYACVCVILCFAVTIRGLMKKNICCHSVQYFLHFCVGQHALVILPITKACCVFCMCGNYVQREKSNSLFLWSHIAR